MLFRSTTARRIVTVAQGIEKTGLVPKLRMKDGAPYRTDGGNYIYDCAFDAISNPRLLATALSNVPGVVEHGLFIGLATRVVLAGPDGARVLERR